MSPLTRLAWWWLRRRGWAVQLNTPDRCTDVYEGENGRMYDRGWRPYFSVRYGKTPIYRVGPDRLSRSARTRLGLP